MKTPIDATGHPGATVALLNSGSPVEMCGLWQITLNGGAVIRWHDSGLTTPLVFNGNTYVAGPLIERGKISAKLGVEVASLDATFTASLTDLINGSPLIPFVQGRGFDGATVVLYKAYLTSWTAAITGVLIDFAGRITSIKNVSRTQFTVTVSAWTVLLNVNMGPDVFQAGCLNTHYDANCGLSPSNVAGTIAAGATTTSFHTNLSQADRFFEKGTITFTSGPNAGLSRAIASYANASGAITVAFPLPFAPVAGNSFNAVRGCLLNMSDCSAQSNLIHFRGAPFTPAAITGVLGS